MRAVWPVLALLVMAAMGHGAYAITDLPEDTCAPEVDRELRQYGLALEDTRDVSWVIDRWNDDEGKPDFLQPISGFRFYGRPAHCDEGRLIVYMNDSCGISDIRTRGDCNIPGIRHGWFF